MSPLRVAVLGGGRSSEHDVSRRSAASVGGGLIRAGHSVVAIDVERDGRWLTEDGEVTLKPAGGLLGADVAFPVLHGPYGEDGTVQGLLECLDIPYVGAGVLASALAMDKVLAKEVLAGAGLPQVAYAAVREAEFLHDPTLVLSRLESLGWPLWVKPARLGSSVGIAPVAEAGGLPDALRIAFAHDSLVIVEAGASGLEVECSVIGDDQPIVSEPGEIVLTRAGWYDYEAKYEPGGMELMVPARISPAARVKVQELARSTFTALGCSGLARVDFFVDGEQVLVNELNTMPGFTETSVFGKLFSASGIEYAELLDRLVTLALVRHQAVRAHRF